MGSHVARGQGFISSGKSPRNHQVPGGCALCCPDLLGTLEFFPLGLKNQGCGGQGRPSAYFRGPQGKEMHLELETWPCPHPAVVWEQ